MSRPRLSLPFDAWPERDRQAWLMRTVASKGLFGPDRLARRLRPATLRKAFLDYAVWLRFLVRHELLDPAAAPALRATPAHLDAFIEDQWARGNSNATIRGRLCGLRMALRLIAPEVDTRFIIRPHGVSLRRWLPDEPRTRPFLHVRDIAERAQLHFQAGVSGRGYARGACAIRDAVLMGLLAMRGPRIGSVGAMAIGEDIVRQETRWIVQLPPEHTKTQDRISWPVPDELTDMLDVYVDRVRPSMAGSQLTTALWMGTRGRPLCARDIGKIVRRRSLAWFGWSFGPHACRRFITTTVATEAPQLLPEAAAMQGHGAEVQMKHYNDAKADAAARRYAGIVERLRDETEVRAARRYGWDAIDRDASQRQGSKGR